MFETFFLDLYLNIPQWNKVENKFNKISIYNLYNTRLDQILAFFANYFVRLCFYHSEPESEIVTNSFHALYSASKHKFLIQTIGFKKIEKLSKMALQNQTLVTKVSVLHS